MSVAKPCLVVTDAVVLSASSVAEVSSAPDISTRCDVASLKAIPSTSYATVLSLAERPGHHTADVVAELARVLKPDGTLLLQEAVGVRSPHQSELKALGASRVAQLLSTSAIERSLLLSGFSSWKQEPSLSVLQSVGLAPEWTGITPASVGSVQGPLLQPVLWRAQKPAWTSGASFALKRKVAAAAPAPSAAAAGAAQQPAPATWKVADDGEELVDEDSLLTPEDMALPTPPVAAGCDPSKPIRKACKNCTCGRAEMEAADAAGTAAARPAATTAAKAKLTVDQLENPQSACGSCGLGDAFRCAGCPYRGLPPFKLGEKVTLGSSVLSADV